MIDQPPNAGWNLDETRRRLDEVRSMHGPWTAHNVHLGHGVYPLGQRPLFEDPKLCKVTRIVRDCLRRPLSSVRILDLACLEGMYAIELAGRGAEVVAIEGRRSNLAKAQLAADAWQFDRLTLIHDDVRHLSAQRYGEFEVVLCLGILYHLTTPDVFQFVRQIASVCREFAVFDTHVSLKGDEQFEWEGNIYRGETYREFPPDSTEEVRLNASWSSLDNETSFWLTRGSLFALLERAGFGSVFECVFSTETNEPLDRFIFLAFKGAAE